MNLTKEIKDLYSENYTTLKKEIKKDKNNGNIYRVHGLEDLTTLKCLSILPKEIYRINTIPIKIPMTILHQYTTNILKIPTEP